MKKALRAAFAAAVGAGVVLASGWAHAADKPVRWKMASAYNRTLAISGPMGLFFIDEVKKASDGTMRIQYFEPGALVPTNEIFNAVSTGAVDAGWASPGFWTGHGDEFAIFSGVPFGPAGTEMLTWLYRGGGQEMMDKTYARFNIKSLPCVMLSPEAGGWFNKEVKTTADLRGLKMRFFGLGAKVVEKYGVSTQLLGVPDIYPALERGTIDATELSVPAIDYSIGLYQVAKYYYFPGWQQPSTVLEFMVNLDRWKALSDRQRQIIELSCRSTMAESIADSESAQAKAVRDIEAKGVQIRSFSPELIETFRKGWTEVVDDLNAKDPEFAEVWKSLAAFRADYAQWRKINAIE